MTHFDAKALFLRLIYWAKVPPLCHHLGPRVTLSRNPQFYPFFPSKTLELFSAMVIAWRKMMTSLLAVERLENLARKAPLDQAHLRAAAALNLLSN